jgi:hypothetical protein
MNEQNVNEMTPIEETMLKGISLRLMVTIIVATITICGTFLGTYYRFQSALTMTAKDVSAQRDDIKDIKNTQHSFDLRLQQQQLQANTQEVRLNEIEKRVNK